MIRINLLPFRAARKKENIRRQVSLFFLSVFLVLISLSYYHITLNHKIKDLNVQVKTTKKQLIDYTQVSKDIANIKSKLKILSDKMNVIKQLESNRREPLNLLDAMTSVVIPKRMWFTRFESRKDTVRIRGNALDNQTVADFMTRLETTGLFENVSLKILKKNKIKDVKISLKSFEITCIKNKPKALQPDDASKAAKK